MRTSTKTAIAFARDMVIFGGLVTAIGLVGLLMSVLVGLVRHL
ncbi:hypothetical protein [Mycobacterium deserti]|uniref:Uncharacterized protein n=1 Tax=Mycobacterium deserti TaxID=2978347 RepID=A0ABT2MAQ6_9MYCO|nr:hypothetical protein [Mycobacterium deserti]MCT7658495.1 hypothetical protein [Mycobacterium deserti]